MINAYKKRTIVLIASICIIILGFCASIFSFYRFDTIVTLNNKNAEHMLHNITNSDFYYKFGDGELTLFRPDTAADSDILWYYLNDKSEVNLVEGGEYKNCAAFLAVMPEGKSVNGSGEKAIHKYAKAVTDKGSGHYAKPNNFDISNVPFEVVMNTKEITQEEDITLYFNKEPLCNTQVVLNTAYGTKEVVSDKYGVIKLDSLKELPSGIEVKYEDESDVYISSIIAQHSEKTLFGFLNAIKPILITILICVLCIIILLIIRKKLSGENEKYYIDAFKTKSNRKDAFWKIRETIQFIFFILIFFGSYIFGFKISGFEVPVYACGWNTNQFIPCGSCYYISHISYWIFDLGNSIDMFKGFIRQMNWQVLDFIFWGIGWIFGTIFILIFFGRLLCSFFCPFGFVQDKLNDLRQALHIKEFNISNRGYNILKIIQVEMVVLFIGLGFFGIDYCHFCPALITTSPAFSGFRISVYISMIAAVVVIVGSFFKERFFCTICPMGFIIGLFNKICPVKLKKHGDKCTECGGCYDACPMGIKSIYTEHDKQDLTSQNCLFCGKCINQCPQSHALFITVFGKEIYHSSLKKFLKRQLKKGKMTTDEFKQRANKQQDK